ncbi:TRAP transporter substrate-binding protein DctP [Bacillus sp. EB600]|uniref:TRAP transporter substrate-binding protein n=1 Tax=Bacillus sp. EB600 TaxID=2806345 RepID=UPI00210D0B19|nr:TRAP transporter substrate-binding protein DctP [Bacillus sp. EB600]MCQ6279573.1 TRAP transporter substrate-binding protein DctP [Bacillus sp. EB600]
MRKSSLLISILLIIGLLLSACGGQKTTSGSATSGSKSSGSSKDQIVIKMADHYPTGHFLLKPTEDFQKRAIELSHGKIKFDYYPGGQLGSINEMGGLVKDGAVDLGYTLVASAGFLPLTSVTSLPSVLTNSTDEGTAFAQLLDGPLASEWEKNGLKPIYSFVNPPNSILSTKKKITSINDLKGLKVRGSGGVLNFIPEIFGASGVSIGVNDLYESMQRGVADAALFPISSAPSYHLNEMTKYVLTGTNFGATTQVYAMNLKKWNSLPKDVQDALIQAGKEATAAHAKLMDQKEKESIETFKKDGIQITEVTPEQHKQILKKVEPVDKQWLEGMKQKGIDGTKILQDYRSITEKVSENKKK